MLATFEVGQEEIHFVEVSWSFFAGREIVKVDGKEVSQKSRHFWKFKDRTRIEVGVDEKHTIDIIYEALKLESPVYVDDRLFIGCLFPQWAGHVALFAAGLALGAALA